MADTVEKNINININSDIEPTLKNLRELKLALKSAAAGSDDFRKIQTKIDDVEDSLKGAKTSAGNFVDILGTVPGPIGDIGAKASGTIDILKSFGKLKLTDITKSFMDLGGDLKEAGKGIANVTGLTKIFTKTNEFLAGSFIKLGAAEGTAAIGAKAFSVALISTGIGAIVVGLGLLIGALIEFVSGEKEATAEIDKFNAAIEASNNAIEDQTATLVREHQKQIADLKATGATEKTIRDKELQQRKEDLVNAQNAEAKKLKELRAAYLLEDEDNRKVAIKKANDDYRDATKTRKDLDSNYYVKAQENRGADLKEAQAAADKEKKQNEDNQKKAIADYKVYQQNRLDAQEETANIASDLRIKNIADEKLREQEALNGDIMAKNKAAFKTIKNKEDYIKRLEVLAAEGNDKLLDIDKKYDKQRKEQVKLIERSLMDEMAAGRLNEKDAIDKSYDDLIKTTEETYKTLTASITGFYVDTESAQKAFISTGVIAASTNADYITELTEKINAKRAEAQKALIEKQNAQTDAKNKSELDKLIAFENQKSAIAEETLRVEYEKTVTARKALSSEEKLFDDDGIAAKIKYYKDLEKLRADELKAEKETLEKVTYLTEAENQNKAQKIQDIDKKIAENKKSIGDDIIKLEEDRNLLSLEKIDAYLQAATALVSAFSEFVSSQNALQAQDTREKYNQQESDAYMSYKADMENSALTSAQKDAIKADYDEASSTRAYERALQEYEDAKTGFDNGKKVQYAQATIAGIQGAIGAFSSLAPIPIVGPILGGIAAAAVAASTVIQLATISKTNYSGKKPLPPIKQDAAGGGAAAAGSSGSKFAEGGLLTGRKHSEGGIPTSFGQLEGGEYVVNRSATEAFMPLLDKINGMGQGSGAPNNLSVVGEQTIPAPAPIIKTYVVASDMTNEQEANRRLEQIARL